MVLHFSRLLVGVLTRSNESKLHGQQHIMSFILMKKSLWVDIAGIKKKRYYDIPKEMKSSVIRASEIQVQARQLPD